VDTLEELRLLSNLETDTEKLLQIVMLGQPELDKTLQVPQLRQLQSRVAYEVYLKPLSCKEVWRYLNFRMQQAGYSGEPVFSKKIACRIQALTQGLPREINFLADKLLMTAFGHGDEKIKTKHFKEAGYSPKGFQKVGFIAVLLIVALFVSVGLYLAGFFQELEKKSEKEVVDSLKVVPKAGVQSEQVEPALQASNEIREKGSDSIATSEPSAEVTSDLEIAKTSQEKFESLRINAQKKHVVKENIRLLRLALALNLSPEQAQPIFEVYQATLPKVIRMFEKAYTVQLMVGPIEALPEVYKRVQKSLPSQLKQELMSIIDLKEERFILLVSYNDGFSKLKALIERLPSEVTLYAPYVMMTDKYQKIFDRTENYLQKAEGI